MAEVVAPRPTGWTVDTLATHLEALRTGDEKFQTERDRRNTEVAAEREKALKIKETADLAALSLAREIQTYKDDKADKARDLSLSERGAYVTRADLELVVDEIRASLKPLFDFVAGQRGLDRGNADSRTNRRADSSQTVSIIMAVVAVAAVLVTIFTLVSR